MPFKRAHDDVVIFNTAATESKGMHMMALSWWSKTSGCTCEAGQGNDQLLRLSSIRLEAMVPVERNSRIVLGIDDQRKDGDLGAQRAQGRVREKRAAELAPLKGQVDRQAPNPGDRDRWIPW